MQMIRVHTNRFLGYWLVCAGERLLNGFPGKTCVMAGRVAEEGDDTCCADKLVHFNAEEEHEHCTGCEVLPHLDWFPF